MQIEIAVSLIREILRSSFALLKLTFIFVDGRERSKINRVAASFHLASKNFWSTFSRLLLRLVVNFEKLQSLFIVPSVFLCRWNSFYFFLFICVCIYIYTHLSALFVFDNRSSSARQVVSSRVVKPPPRVVPLEEALVSKLIRGDIPRFNR